MTIDHILLAFVWANVCTALATGFTVIPKNGKQYGLLGLFGFIMFLQALATLS